MSTNFNSDKEQLIWIGEHAQRVYMKTNSNVLSNYRNYLLLFSDDGEKIDDSIRTTYLNHDSNEDTIDYEEHLLNEPVTQYMKKVSNASKVALIIGSPYELLMKVVVKSFCIDLAKSMKVKTAFSYENTVNLTTQYQSSVIDLPSKRVLFLDSNVPFKDMNLEGKELVKHAHQGFISTVIADENLLDLSEFLFRYHEDRQAAIQQTKGIQEI